MAIGKNKKLARGGKKGAKKKAGDPFLKKEWYDLKAPSVLGKRDAGKTLVTKTQGTKIASEGLKGRVVEINLSDLQRPNDLTGEKTDEDNNYKKIRMCIEEVQGKHCLMDFHGLSFTRDKLCHLVKKWQSLIEANVDVKTTDGYTLRLFCIGFTAHPDNHVDKNAYGSNQYTPSNCYAQTSQIRRIRAKMVEIMTQEVVKSSLKECVRKFVAGSIEKDIEKRIMRIFPMKRDEIFIRKVKVLKKPKFDITKLMELHYGDDGGQGADMLRPETEGAENILTAEMRA